MGRDVQEKIDFINDNRKGKTPQHTIDFVTALSPAGCIERLQQDELSAPRISGIGGWLAPAQQTVIVHRDNEFTIERRYPGALVPIRLSGQLDQDRSGGTWVHGAVTHDVENQIWVEGLIVFMAFFVLTTIFFLRLKWDGLLVSIVLFGAILVLATARWRGLNEHAADTARWVRRKLYVTREQLRK